MERHADQIRDAGARIVAASSDPAERARETRAELDLSFTVLWGLDAERTAELIGCYTGERQGASHIQPAGFVLDRGGVISLAVYSSGKVGRMTAADALTALSDG